MAELEDKLDSIRNRHKYNRLLMVKFIVAAAASLVLLWTISLRYLDIASIIGFLTFFGFIIAYPFFVLPRLKTITVEEHMLQDLSTALTALKKAKRTSDTDQLSIALKKLKSASKRPSSTFLQSSPPISSVVVDYDKIIDRLTEQLAKDVSEKAKQDPNQLQSAIEDSEKFVSMLTNPTFETAKALADSFQPLKEELQAKKPTRNWGKMMENRAVQASLSSVAAIFIPPAISILYSVFLGIDPIMFMRQNPTVLIAGAFVIFAGVLAWTGRK